MYIFGELFIDRKKVIGMNESGISAKVMDELRALAVQHQIEKMVLFGSRARGDYHRTSDIDLAVLGGDVSRFALDVEEETSTLLQFDIVDLGQPVQPALLDAIDREGKVLYEKV